MSYKFSEPGNNNSDDIFEIEDLETNYDSNQDTQELKVDLQEDLDLDYVPKVKEMKEDKEVMSTKDEEEKGEGPLNLNDLATEEMFGPDGYHDILEEDVLFKQTALLEDDINMVEESGCDDSKEDGEEDSDIVLPKQLKWVILIIVALCVIVISYKVYRKSLLKLEKNATSNIEQQIRIPVENNKGQEMKFRVLTRSNMEASDQLYKDYLIVDKKTELIDDNVVFSLTGNTTKEGKEVRLHLTLEEYNNMTTGQIIEIEFRLIKVDGKIYTCDSRVLGVIAE